MKKSIDKYEEFNYNSYKVFYLINAHVKSILVGRKYGRFMIQLSKNLNKGKNLSFSSYIQFEKNLFKTNSINGLCISNKTNPTEENLIFLQKENQKNIDKGVLYGGKS